MEPKVGQNMNGGSNLSYKAAAELWIPAPTPHVMLSELDNTCGDGSPQKLTAANIKQSGTKTAI